MEKYIKKIFIGVFTFSIVIAIDVAMFKLENIIGDSIYGLVIYFVLDYIADILKDKCNEKIVLPSKKKKKRKRSTGKNKTSIKNL